MNLYGIQNRSTINSLSTTMCRDNLENRKYFLIDRGYECVSIAQVIGYVDVNYMVICDYYGKYGYGFVVCSNNRNPYTGNASSRFMNIEYWVKKED